MVKSLSSQFNLPKHSQSVNRVQYDSYEPNISRNNFGDIGTIPMPNTNEGVSDVGRGLFGNIGLIPKYDFNYNDLDELKDKSPERYLFDVFKNRGSLSSRKIGKRALKVGQTLGTIGALSNEPVVSGIGLALDVAGEILQGGSVVDTTKNITGDIVGAVVGSKLQGLAGESQLGKYVAGALGNELGQSIGQSIGEPIGEFLGSVIPDRDRIHHDTLKQNLTDTNHQANKEDVHNSSFLPSSLQAIGQQDANTKEEAQSLLSNIPQFNGDEQALQYLGENMGSISSLDEAQKNQLFGQMGVNNIFSTLVK